MSPDQLLAVVREAVQDALLPVQAELRRLGERMDQLEQRMARMEQRLDGLEQRLNGLEQRLDGLEQRLDGLEQRVDALEARVGSMEQQLVEMKGEIRDWTTRMDAFEAFLDRRLRDHEHRQELMWKELHPRLVFLENKVEHHEKDLAFLRQAFLGR
ncbi:coiled-coil domain-containing protein [Calditerricola satsumensis]|uniref:Uncharacterized protein n=2 Tax=Calditerricola satsumensis TaxID=373054 RepID=A0A8J3BAU0_9BACI|nr:hypothetical protein [Calditerricola satsumensis]GGK07111.1 hypothetical protein GCM10007043_21510 [Calditerricola satsumensis]